MAVIDNNTIMSQPYSYDIDGTNIKSIPISSNKIFVIYQDNYDNICKGIIVTNTNTGLTKTVPVNISNFDLPVDAPYETLYLFKVTNEKALIVAMGSDGMIWGLIVDLINDEVQVDESLNTQLIGFYSTKGFCPIYCRNDYLALICSDGSDTYLRIFDVNNYLSYIGLATLQINNDIELLDSLFLKGTSLSSYWYVIFAYRDNADKTVKYNIAKFLSDLTDVSLLLQEPAIIVTENISGFKFTNLAYSTTSNPNVLITYITENQYVLKALLARADTTTTDDIQITLETSYLLDIYSGVTNYDITKIYLDKAFVSLSTSAEAISTCIFVDNTLVLYKGISYGMGNLTASSLSVSNLIENNDTIVTFRSDSLSTIQSVVFSEQQQTYINFNIKSYSGETTILSLSNIKPIISVKINSSLDNSSADIELYDGNGTISETIIIPQIENKKFIGLSSMPNNYIAEIKNDGLNYSVSFNEDTTLYLAYIELPQYYDYNIKDSTGSYTLSTVKTTGLASSLSISKVNNIITVTINGVTASFTPPEIDHMEFKGLSKTPNSEIVEFNIGETYNVNFGDNAISLYCVYEFVENVIVLYQNSAERNRVDKTSYLTKIKTISGAVRDVTSIVNISILIEYDTVPNFNYCYLPAFRRYYYITDVSTVNKNLWELSLSCDVLMSYKEAIKNCNGFIERNENLYNENIVDKQRVIEQGYDIEEINLDNELFDYTVDSSVRNIILSGYYIFGDGSLASVNIVYAGENCTITGASAIDKGTTTTAKVVPNYGYELTTAEVGVTGATLVSFDNQTGELVFGNTNELNVLVVVRLKK